MPEVFRAPVGVNKGRAADVLLEPGQATQLLRIARARRDLLTEILSPPA